MAQIKRILEDLLSEEAAEYLADQYPTMRLLANLTEAELKAIPGVTPAKARHLARALRIGRAMIDAESEPGKRINSPDVAMEYLSDLQLLETENFAALYLDCKNGLIKREVLSRGSLNSSVVHPREVLAPGVRLRAASVILAHNHPSGDPSPSREDVEVTRRLVEAGRILGIDIVDHLIIGSPGWISMKQQGLM